MNITDKAKHQLELIRTNENITEPYLRLGVLGGGCSGMTYDLGFDHKTEDDLLILVSGISVVVNKKVYEVIKEVSLDFEDGIKGKGFVFSNKAAKQVCGCNRSFC